MRRLLYRAALKMLPQKPRALAGNGLNQDSQRRLARILRSHRCLDAEFRLFPADGSRALYLYGAEDYRSYRLASISKMLTAACALKLQEAGKLDIDADVNTVLPYALRHKHAPGAPISLRQLMTHTAGLRDGEAYSRALREGLPVDAVLMSGDSFMPHSPGERWSYSNLGAGLVACVMEAALQEPFENIMQGWLFRPLGMRASFYPSRVPGSLADARPVLPPWAKPGFCAAQRRVRDIREADKPSPRWHYTLSQGNCCCDGASLQRFAQGLMRPGYLTASSIRQMTTPLIGFGVRSASLQQAVGNFVLKDERISQSVLIGHQGNAYGAMHCLFLEPNTGRGMFFLSEGVSQARREFLGDVVEELLRFAFEEAQWSWTA